jgi:hypothetical protein
MNFFTFFRNDFDLGLCIGLHSLHFSAAMIKSGSLFERFATFLLPPKRQRLSFVNFAISLWFSAGTPVACTNKSNRHDIIEILLKVALSIRTLTILTLLYSTGTFCLIPESRHY